jgi:6-phosphogluconolactonase
MTSDRSETIVCKDDAAVNRRAADVFVKMVQEATRREGRFTVALSGGSTPKGLYVQLTQAPYRERIPWSRVHLFWGDERCVPPYHPDSNFRLANDALLTHIPIPAANIHRVPTELNDCSKAAARYAHDLTAFFELQPGAFPHFDLVLLGVGDDGHTASLFPGMPSLEERHALAVATPPGRLPPSVDRVTLTLPVLNAAHCAVFLVTGQGKASLIKHILAPESGGTHEQLLPAQRVHPLQGKVLWIIDEAAGQLLG